MLKKLFLPFALFLALVLCACGAYALELNMNFFPQTHLQSNNGGNSQEVSLHFQSLSGAVEPLETAKVYEKSTITTIKKSLEGSSSTLADDTAEDLLGAINYTGKTSMSNTEPTWSEQDGLDHMQQNRIYYLDNGELFRLNTNVLLFDLSLRTKDKDGNDTLLDMANVALKEDADKFFGKNRPYLSLNEENNPSSDLPKPSAILSASIMDITGNTWDRTNNVEFYIPSASDWYSFDDEKSLLHLIDKDHMGDDFGNETLPNIVANAKEASLSLVNGPTFAAVNHFSPYAFVWTEVELLAAPLAAPDVPHTGDSASLAPWLLLLGGAFALLLLAKKKSAASA